MLKVITNRAYVSGSVTTLCRIKEKITLICRNRRWCPTFEIFKVSTISKHFQNEISHLKLYFTAKDDQVNKMYFVSRAVAF